MPPQPSQSYALPIAILLGFGIVASVIFFSNATGGSASTIQPATAESRLGGTPSTEVVIPVPPVHDADFVRGNPDAAIMFITYTDYECTACKNYYDSLNRLIQDYGMTGQVAWTQRHMALPEIHENSMVVANATECVGSLGGNRAFWKFTDRIFQERDLLSGVDLSTLPDHATASGIAVDEFTSCVEDERYYGYLADTTEDALNAGAAGVPYTIVMTGSEQGGLNGAQTYTALQMVTEELLTQLENFVEQNTAELGQ